MKKCISIGLLALIIMSSCAKENSTRYETTITRTDSTSISLDIEIAKTSEERARGFMERENIPEGTGMLFIFDRDQILRFWMKDTPSPLSIAYINAKGVIKEIHDLKPFSLASVSSATSCRYALEVPQNWFKKNDIGVGSVVRIPN